MLVMHAEESQVLVDAPHHLSHGEVAHGREPLRRVRGRGVRAGERALVARGERLAHGDQVVAPVLQPARHPGRVFLLSERRAEGLQVAPVGGPGERVHLRTRVVDVVFLAHLVARLGEQVGERVADDGTAAVADVQGTGRVRGDVFHVHALPLPRVAVAILLTRAQDGREDGPERVGAQTEVDEAWPGRLGACQLRRVAQAGGERVGELPRRNAGRLGGDHGRVGREVAVLRVAGGRGLDAGGERRVEVRDLGGEGVEHAGVDGAEQVSGQAGPPLRSGQGIGIGKAAVLLQGEAIRHAGDVVGHGERGARRVAFAREGAPLVGQQARVAVQ